MIDIPSDLRAALFSVENRPVDLYELELDSGTLYFADQDIVWGGHHYLGKVRSRSAIKRYMGGQFDDVTVTFANVDTTMAAALLQEEIEGRRLVIRMVDRTVPDASIVRFSGPMKRLSKVNENDVEISATDIFGSIDFDAPARVFGDLCPWDFKSPQCGYAGSETQCNKSWARCSQLGQTARYGGFRFIPHSGVFQYEEVSTQRFLLLFRRKKVKTITASYSSIDDTPYGAPIPIVYGRSQLAGIVIEHEDQGAVTKALVAFCIGKVQDFFYVRANQAQVTDVEFHYGTFGGDPGQGVDSRFPNSYPYSQLAFLGITIPSDVKAVDPAPSVTAVIFGRGVPIFNADGTYSGLSAATVNPVWNTRDFLTLPLVEGGMGIPEALIDDVVNYQTAAYCDELIADTTGDQQIFNPTNLPSDVYYQRYKSSGVDGVDPTVDQPGADFAPGVNDDTSTTPAAVNVKRFTMNGALARQEKAVDILFNKLLPSFRGYLTQSAEGKIQIRCEKAVKNTTLTGPASAGASSIAVATVAGWNAGDLVLISPFTARAEVATIAGAISGGLTLAGTLAHAHLAGEVVMKVAMAFDDRNMTGEFEYPLSDRVSSTNRVTVKYVDAPAGFQEKELHVNDYEHQAAVHKVNNEDADGGMIDSYFQAWRIGEWLRAKRRDLGKFCSFAADMTAMLLEIGDVYVVSAVEAGLQCVPFLVVEHEQRENDEVGIVGQLYSIDVYNDQAPQCTVQVPTVFSKAAAATGVITALKAKFSGSHATEGVAYEGAVAGEGGALPYTYSVTSGALPAGLALNASTGAITGTPTAPGTYTFTARVTDAALTTADVVCVIAVALASGTSAAATVSYPIDPADNTGARWGDPALHAVIDTSLSLTAGPRVVTFWAGKHGGTRAWRGQWALPAGASTVSIGAMGSGSEVYPPTAADETWEVVAAVGAYGPADAIPAGAVVSNTFTMHAPQAPGTTEITAAYLTAVSPSYATFGVGASKYGWSGYSTLPIDPATGKWLHPDKSMYARLLVQTGQYVGGVWTPGGEHPDDPTLDVPTARVGDWTADDDHADFMTRVAGTAQIYMAIPNNWNVPSDGNVKVRFFWLFASRLDDGTGSTKTLQHSWSAAVGDATPATNTYQELTVDGTKAYGKGHQIASGTLGFGLRGGSGANPYVATGSGLQDDGSGNLTLRLGNGLSLSLGSAVINAGPGLAFNGFSQVVPNLGNGLAVSGSQIIANLGNGLGLSGGAIVVNLGNGLAISGGAVTVNLGNGLTLSGAQIVANLGNGLGVSSGQIVANLGNGLQFSAGTVTVNLGGGLTLSGSQIAASVDGTTLQVVSTISIKNGGVGPTQISSVNASQLNAGTVNVGSGGITMSGTGGVNVISGGNVAVTPGYVISQGFKTYFGYGYEVNGSTAIDYNRNFSGASLSVSGAVAGSGFNPTGYTGASATIAFKDGGGSYCSVEVGGVNLGAVRLHIVNGVYVGTI